MTQPNTPANLLKVRIKNFMGISNVEIKPDQINQVVGENNQGKTTLLKAIEFVFKGSTNGQLVKHGEDQAEVFVELPDGHSIRRTLKPDGSQNAIVRDSKDFKIPAPQSFLNELVDHSGFNPLEVLEPSKRTEAILKAIDLRVTPEIIANRIGVNPADLPSFDYNKHGLKVIDEAYNYYDKRRTEANRDALKKEEKFKAYESEYKPMPPPETSREDIKDQRDSIAQRRAKAEVEVRSIKEIEDRNAEIQKNIKKYRDEAARWVKETNQFVFEKGQEIQDREAQIKKLQEECKKLESEISQRVELSGSTIAQNEGFAVELEKTLRPVPDKSEYEAELSNCREYSAVLDGVEKEWVAHDATKQNRQFIDNLKREWETDKAYAETIEQQAKLLQHKFKKELMATVEMPLEGLEYDEGLFLVDGTPIDQLSSSKAMKLAINVARKLHKKNKIILADGVERLDDKVRAEFFAEIKNDGFTYFFANVGEGDPNYPSIQMRQGMVVQ